MKNTFVGAIHSKNKVMVSFHSKEDQQILNRKCAPMDYGPGSRSKNKEDRYHFWDYESDEKPHTLSLHPEQVISITVLTETFEPKTFVSWLPVWIIPRNW